jgi:hypothetical protein
MQRGRPIAGDFHEQGGCCGEEDGHKDDVGSAGGEGGDGVRPLHRACMKAHVNVRGKRYP